MALCMYCGKSFHWTSELRKHEKETCPKRSTNPAAHRSESPQATDDGSVGNVAAGLIGVAIGAALGSLDSDSSSDSGSSDFGSGGGDFGGGGSDGGFGGGD